MPSSYDDGVAFGLLINCGYTRQLTCQLDCARLPVMDSTIIRVDLEIAG